MIVIGERINGMFRSIGNAIAAKDKKPIQEMAERQLAAGADALDINVGTGVSKAERPEVMRWLVEATREVTDKPLSIDSPNIDVMRAGLEIACRKGSAIINSTTGAQDRLDSFMSLAKEFGTGIIGLAIDENGIANTVDDKVEIGMRAVAAAMEKDVPVEDVYLDPIILPVKSDQTSPGLTLETIRQFRMLSDPPPHVVVGLSNVGQQAAERSLITRTFLVMAIAAGMDASIHDPLDEILMSEMITAELLMNKSIYSDSYLRAYMQKA
jgi:5-methyltetrahydrofolate corrinoid/iron sulfur protein methyltransferase